MSNYRRAFVAGGTYFFTVTTAHRRPLLTQPGIRSALRAGITQARQTLPFSIDAWVLLPDHLHCIWTLPPEDANFSARWAIIKRQVSRTHEQGRRCVGRTLPERSASQWKRRESGFWQRRFWEHLIRDEEDLRSHIEYIHWNPMKHGYIQTLADWPYSTFQRFVQRGLYPANWGGQGVQELSGEAFGE